MQKPSCMVVDLNMDNLTTQDWENSDEFNLLVDDCKSILTEGVFRSRQELIDTYKQLGERITTDPIYKKWGQTTQGKFMKSLQIGIGKGLSTLYYAIEFYERISKPEEYKEFSKALENSGKNISWTKIIALLPAPKKDIVLLPQGEFNVIYADPPWNYGDKQNTRMFGGAEKHYSSMTIEELCQIKLPVADNAVLFMWVTSPLLDECWPVINAWGFEYKTSFVWDKVKHNMGHYNSVRHEFLLVCTRGSMMPEVNKLYDSVVTEERTDTHSQKPPIFYEIIETLYPNGKYLEMFARNKREKWTSWGNEI